MKSYHGTTPASATQILTGVFDVTLGGGELGRGFYTGQYPHVAKAWAYQKSGATKKNVVEIFTRADDDIVKLDIQTGCSPPGITPGDHFIVF